MDHRRVSSVYLELDSEDMIRAKDQGTRRPNPSDINQDVLPAMASVRKANKTPGIADQQNLTKDSSKVVDIASQTSAIQSGYVATEHAMPDSRQHVSALFDNQSIRKQPLAQHKARESESTLNVESQSTKNLRIIAERLYSSQLYNNAQTASLGIKSMKKGSDSNKPKTILRKQRPSVYSRPKRNSKALHTLPLQTEVDWSEDLRPTPSNERQKDDGDARGTTVSTPSPGSISVLDKTSNQKRKRPKSRLNSEKRKKPGNEKATGANESDRRRPQLRLTDTPGLPPAFQLASYPKSDVVPHAEPSETPSKKSVQAKAGSGKTPEVVVEIPSRASPSTGFYTSDDDLEKPPSQRQQQNIVSHDGRGKSVGQKLFDALRAVELQPQPMPTLNTESHPRKTGVTTDCDNSSIKVDHVHTDSAQASSREFSIPRSEPKRGQGTLTGDQKSMVPERCQPGSYVQSPATETGASKEIETKSHMIYQGPRRVPRSRPATDSGTNQPLNEVTASYRNRQLHVSGPSVMRPSLKLHVHGSSLRTAIEIPESQNNPSSLSSADIENITLAGWPLGDRGDEQTPESQRPLLTNKKPFSRSVSVMANSKSIPINSIVDRNGSPRLAAQSDTHLDVLQGSTDTSASVYHQDSSGPSLGSSSEDRRTWTKFQRDMFQEYGITAQDLASAPNRPGLARGHAQAQTISTGTSLASNKQDSWVAPTMAPPQVNGNRTIGKDAKTPNEKVSVEQVADPFSEGREQDQVSTKILNAGQPMCEPSRGTSDPMEWISALQAAQKSAHHLLQDTNQNLSNQLAAEQATVHRVLQIYRQGCNHILDDLFQTQEVRMELYRRQMASVKTQHKQICQEMIRGLQELDRRVQQE